MSRSRDDYAGSDKNRDSGEFIAAHDSEPADPDTPDHSTRRSLPLAPDSVKPGRLPDPFVSDKGRAVTVEEAGETYLKIQRANWNNDSLTSKYERHNCELYRRIHHADRTFQAEYDDLTTAMLTRRLSPLDDSGSWLTPWDCNEMLHGGSVHRSVRKALDHHLGAFESEWLAVTAPTRSAGTPHEHIYIWVDDPDDTVTTEHIEPALEKHLKYCANAYEEDHQYRTDETGRAITVHHTPPLSKQSNPEVAKHVVQGNTSPYANTAGAVYLATQLAHLHIHDFYAKDRATPPKALFEGAALAWVSPYNWFRSSQGVES